jgi:predicted O-methyltransferase YrrM
MNKFRHWTPRYVVDRIAVFAYRTIHPDRPWLTPEAVSFLSSRLKPTDAGIEFGSGRSTVWFARRVRQLFSVEHDRAWYGKVRGMLQSAGLENVDYHLIPRDAKKRLGGRSQYVKFLDRFSPDSLDFILVDGLYRDFCAFRALPLIRPGGLLIIDNVNAYLPSDSRSPNSRSLRDGPAGETWAAVERELRDWRKIWTSSGVWDTAIFIRPGA